MSDPADALVAVAHADPYAFYERLAHTRPFYRDEALGCWVASGAEVVTEVLESALCHVRPVSEPVPNAILGSPAETIFRHLVRMNEGERHGPMKHAIVRALASVTQHQAETVSAAWANRLANELSEPADVRNYAYSLPAHVVSDLLGFSGAGATEVAAWTSAFVQGLSPYATPDQAGACRHVAEPLLARMRSTVESRPVTSTRNLLDRLGTEAQRVGCDDPDVIAANAIGLVMQSLDATAGLIGNTLVALSARWSSLHPGGSSDLVASTVQAVLRSDPPIQNTRRFVVSDGVVAGKNVRRGDMILVLLAAANRVLQATPDAPQEGRDLFTFGHGRHVCPGQALAITIAQAGLGALLARRMGLPASVLTRSYRASPNARLPL